jgi:hypothetical protein
VTREDLAEFREEGRSAERQRAFRDADRKIREWESAHPQTLDSILDWIDQLRAVFGDPPVDRRPWSGDDFRL